MGRYPRVNDRHNAIPGQLKWFGSGDIQIKTPLLVTLHSNFVRLELEKSTVPEYKLITKLFVFLINLLPRFNFVTFFTDLFYFRVSFIHFMTNFYTT